MSGFGEKIKKFNILFLVVFYLITFVVPGIYFQQASADSIIHIGSTGTNSDTASSITINKPTNVQSGDVIVAIVGVSGGISTVASTNPSYPWTLITNSAFQSNNGAVVSLYRVAGSSEPSTYNFSSTLTTRLAAGITAYRGVDNVNPIDATSATNQGGSSTALTTSSITTITNHTKVVGVYGINIGDPTGDPNQTNNFTPPVTPATTERIDAASFNASSADVSVALTDYHKTSAGSFNPTAATSGLTGLWATHQFALKSNGVQHMMLFWDGTGAAPTGWSYVTEANGRYLRGEAANNYGQTGGNSTHIPTATVTSSAPSGDESASGNQNAVATQTHTHSASVTAGSANTLPAYRTLKLIRYDAGIPNTIPAGAIAIFDGSPGIPATGWTRMSAFDSKFTRMDSTIASTDGGSDTHNHTLDWSNLANSTQSIGRGPLLFGVNTASHPHSHGDPVNTSTDPTGGNDADICDAAPVDNSCLPPYVQVLLAKADADTAVLSIGLTGMFDGAPGGGWVVRSESGGPYYQRLIRGGASYDEDDPGNANDNGSTAHDHNTINSGASDTDPEGSGGTGETLGTGVAADNHTHTLSANFDAADNTPLYYNIVVAEKVNFIFNHYAWYDDNDAIQVASRYSSLDVGADGHIVPIPTGYDPPGLDKELRLRIQVLVNNSNLAAGEMQFKLQYAEDSSGSLTSSTCTNSSLTWTDIGNNNESTIWKYASSTPSNGALLSSGGGTSIFSPASTSLQRYVKSTSAGTNSGGVNAGETMEWDYHIVNNGANTATQYRFRLVEDSGILLSQYGYGSPTVTPICPTLTTKPDPVNQLRHGNFFENTGQEKGFSWVD